MSDLVFEETYDRFVVLYDLVELVGEGIADESELALSANLSQGTIGQMTGFMLGQGYIRIGKSDSEFRITTLGSNFLKEFEGMRRFLS
jgi:predicted transcriptional regulator